jgi:branched-chain amino acid transport system substrate-binding protein
MKNFIRRILPLTVVLASLCLPGHAKDIVIGQAAPLSGVLAETGREMVSGAQIYFDYINSIGGIKGNKIRHVVKDDGYDVEKTLAITKEFIEREDVLALSGYVGTGNVAKVLQDKILSDAHIALVGPYTGGESLRTPYNPNIFHIRAGYGNETAAIVKHLVQAGMTRIAVLYQNDKFGESGLAGVEAALTKSKLKPVVTATYEKNTDDVANAVKKIAAANPQGIIMISVNKSSAAFIKNYKAIDKKAALFNVSVVNATVLAKIAGEEIVRGVGITQVVPDPFSPGLAITRQYHMHLKQFGKGITPSYAGFEGYMGAKVLVEGIKRAGSNPTRESIINALESIEAFDLGGYIVNFGKNNRAGSTFVDVMMVTKGAKLIR